MNRAALWSFFRGREHVLHREQRVEKNIERVFSFFADAENLGTVTPAALKFRIDTPLPIEMRPGTIIDYTIRLHHIPMRWRTIIADWTPPTRFIDEQLRGPYRQWIHTHSFEADGDATIIRDEVRYRLPFGLLGELVHPIIRRQLRWIFDFRQRVIAEWALEVDV